MLRAVLFDFNGVLINDEPIHTLAIERTLQDEGVSWNRSLYETSYVGISDRGVLEWALKEAGRSVEEPYLMRLLARKRAYYHESIRRDGLPWFSGAIGLIQRLADEGIGLGVVSGAQRDEILAALEQGQIEDHFKIIVSADDVDHGKPDPEGYNRGLTGLNTIAPLPERLLHPHEVLAVEDSRVGLQAAREAGLATLAVTSSFPAEKLEISDRTVDGLAGLSVDDLLLRRP